MATLSERLLEHGIRLTNYGLGNRKTTCPQCSAQRKHPKDPCLSVTIEEDHALWRCHNCGFAGRVNDSEPARSTTYVERRDPTFDTLKLGPMPISYLAGFWKARGISTFTLARAGVQFSKVFFPALNAQSDAFAFPHKADGKIVNVKYRAASAKTFANTKGGERHLWLDHLWDRENGEDLIITEGEIDALSVLEAGIANVVSLPDGALNPGTEIDFKSGKFAWAHLSKRVLEASKRKILALDNDEPGQFMTKALAKLLGYHRCWTVSYPEGCKDLNDVLVKHGVEVVSDVLDNAKPYPVPGFVNLVQEQEFFDLYDHGYPTTFSSGFTSLDPFVRFPKNMLTIVTGRAGHGKSDLLDQISLNMAQKYGWRFAMFSPEYEGKYKAIGMAQKYLSLPYFAGAHERASKDQLKDALAFINSHYVVIDPSQGRTIGHILEITDSFAQQTSLDGLIIDPYNAIDMQVGRGMREDQAITEMLTRVSEFAKRTGIHVFFVAHPTKLGRTKDGKPIDAGMDTISGAQAWQSFADIGIVIKANFNNSTTEVRVEKARYHWIGRIGATTLHYSRLLGIYSDEIPTSTSPWNTV